MTAGDPPGPIPTVDDTTAAPDPVVDLVDIPGLLRHAAVAVVAVAVLGAVAGIVWGLLAPGVTGVVVAPGRAGSLGADTGHRFDALAMFACISFVAGVIGGAGVWWIRALRGPTGAIGAALGAIGGAAAGAWLGGLVAGVRHPGPADTAVGQYFQTAPTLRLSGAMLDTAGGIDLSWAIVVVAPIGALLAYLVLLLCVGRADLGVEPSGWGTQGGELVGDAKTVLGEPVERGGTTA